MPRVSVLVGLGALAAALVAAVLLATIDSYSSSSVSCVQSAGEGPQCSEIGSGRTLAEVNGNRVLWLLAVPVGLVSAILALVVFRGPKPLEWALAIALLGCCVIAAASIGLLFMPAAGLAVTAVALDRASGRRAAAAPA